MMKAPNVTEGEWLAAHNSSWHKDVNVIARQEKAGLHHVSVAFVSSLSEPDAKMLAASKKLAEALAKFAEWNRAYPSSRIYNESEIRTIAAKLDAIYAEADVALKEAGYTEN
jgi:outer membrane receptor for ferric coprogen and ferric-rhodotorulic acid